MNTNAATISNNDMHTSVNSAKEAMYSNIAIETNTPMHTSEDQKRKLSPYEYNDTEDVTKEEVDKTILIIFYRRDKIHDLKYIMQKVIELQPFEVCINNYERRQVIVKYDTESSAGNILKELRKSFYVVYKGQDTKKSTSTYVSKSSPSQAGQISRAGGDYLRKFSDISVTEPNNADIPIHKLAESPTNIYVIVKNAAAVVNNRIIETNESRKNSVSMYIYNFDQNKDKYNVFNELKPYGCYFVKKFTNCRPVYIRAFFPNEKLIDKLLLKSSTFSYKMTRDDSFYTNFKSKRISYIKSPSSKIPNNTNQKMETEPTKSIVDHKASPIKPQPTEEKNVVNNQSQDSAVQQTKKVTRCIDEVVMTDLMRASLLNVLMAVQGVDEDDEWDVDTEELC